MRKKKKHTSRLSEVFSASPLCTCPICVSFCKRPGWWTVTEAARAVEAGYAGRMMLEMAPDCTFGVLAPAFKGCEVSFALEKFASCGCTFLINDLCELHGTGVQPLECRCCHHARPGVGQKCHAALGKDWNSPAGRALVVRWTRLTSFWNLHVNKRHK